jgi:putative ABC transport system substrate-binding protein
MLAFDQLHMQRREFITLVGGAAATSSFLWPLAVSAQQWAKRPTIGFLGAASPAGWAKWIDAFVQRLGELGWIEGRTVAIEYRWAEGRKERFAEIAAEFVQLGVDIIVTSGPAVPAVKQATSVIPIVFPIENDPVGTGLVQSLARPGGNVTGLSLQFSDTVSKRFELLREVVPNLHRLAVMYNAGYPAVVVEMGETRAVARTRGLELTTLEIRRAEDIAPALESLKGRVDALYVASDPLVNAHRIHINSLALVARLPSMHGFREFVEAGGLISYGANFPDMFRRAADLVDKILRGVKPGEIPVEQPTRFDLVINMKTAKALGLTISEAFLLRADEVIE